MPSLLLYALGNTPSYILHSSLCQPVLVQARAPKSPIIIVGTHLDKIPPQKIKPLIDRFKARIKDLYGKSGYPHLSSIMMVSCVTQEGIKDLVERIHYAAVNAVDPDTREPIIGAQVRARLIDVPPTLRLINCLGTLS